MSGGPHHNPHGRQGQLGAGWSHLQVPEYFPRHPMAAHLSSERPLTWHTPAPLVPPTAASAALYRHSPTPPDPVQVLKGGSGLYRHTPTPPDRDLKSFRHTPTPPDKNFGSSVTAIGTATEGRRCATNPLLNLQHVMAAAADNVREHYAENLARNILADDALTFSRRSPAAPGSVDLSLAGRVPPNGEPPSAPHPPVGLSVRDAGRINSLLAARIPLAPSVIVSAPPAPRRPSISDEDSCDSARGASRRRKLIKSSRILTGMEPAEPSSPATAPHEPCLRITGSNHPIKVENINDSRLENGLFANKSSSVEDILSATSEPNRSKENSEKNAIAAAVVSKTRRRSSFEAETIDEIAALIASTEKFQNNGLENHKNIILSNEVKEINLAELDGLKNVLSSPVPENDDNSKKPQVNNNPTTPNRRKRNSKSASTDSPPKDEPDNLTVTVAIKKSSSQSENLSDSSKDKTTNPELQTKPSTKNTLSIDSNNSAAKENSVNKIEISSNNNNCKEVQEVAEKAENDKEEPQAVFVEVENALEKMFAGLEESVSNTQKPAKNVTVSPRKSQTRSRRASRLSSDVNSAASSEETSPKKPLKKKSSQKEPQKKCKKAIILDNLSSKSNTTKKESSKITGSLKLRDGYDSGTSNTSSRSRGPYVQITGPRDSPISVEIVNAPMAEDDTEKSFSKVKTAKVRLPVDVRDKVKSKGLHSSTLSTKYDAITSDPSWICVFCKRGSHAGVDQLSLGVRPMGDLFGPYTITKDCNEYREMLLDPHDLLFKTRPKKMKTDKVSAKKEKDPEPFRMLPNSEVYAGMSGVDADQLEVWTHEDCAVWAPAVRLCGGGRVVGLDAAVWASCVRACDACERGGATVACARRACRAAAHVPCGRASRWRLDSDDFRAFCHKHLPTDKP